MSQRKLLLSMSITLDGYAAGLNDEMDWMNTSPEEWSDLFKDLDEADTYLLGRKMFPGYSDYWQSVLKNPSGSKPDELRFAKMAEKTQHIVFTNSGFKPDWKNTRVAKDPREEITMLKKASGKNIIAWGGANFASFLLQSKLLDEIRLVVNPVILGKGKSLFENADQRINLELIDCKLVNPGISILRYKVN